MVLSKKELDKIKSEVEKPKANLFELPEKVLQFGTGVLLRALPDYYIDKANKQGIFNGRIVVVKSTSTGTADDFDNQDGLYTICVKGIENGINIEKSIINASISRVLNARSEWKEILKCAHNPEMKIIISNTTELGIELVEEDDIKSLPPVSFPAKLLAFLYERYKAFNGASESGMVIIPTELITNNAKILEQIVYQLADINKLEDSFIIWLKNNNSFCNSLVDRIVSGKPNEEEMINVYQKIGYTDHLYCETEVFSLWAIEADDKVRDFLSFAQCNDGIVIQPDINLFRELKLRLLNATHTFNCGIAFLSGFNLTRESVLDKSYALFVKNIMQKEIEPAIPFEIDQKLKRTYGDNVIERFSNPYINHRWISITTQFTSKIKMRCIPLIKEYYKLFQQSPIAMAAGFAGYLLFMKSVKFEDGKYYGELNGALYPIVDEHAAYFFDLWYSETPTTLVASVLSNKKLWGEDLQEIPGFEFAVILFLKNMMHDGVFNSIANIGVEKEDAVEVD